MNIHFYDAGYTHVMCSGEWNAFVLWMPEISTVFSHRGHRLATLAAIPTLLASTLLSWGLIF